MDIKESLIIKNNFKRHPWETVRAEIIHKLLKKYCFNSNEKNMILDIGCGDAFLIQNLSKYYPKSTFVGIDHALDIEIIKKIQFETIIPNLEIYSSLTQIPYGKNSVDIVLLLDVLEHVEDDTEFLKNILTNQIIKKGAVCLLTVPAFNFLFSEHDRFLEHFRRYNHKELICLVSQTSPSIIFEYGYFYFFFLIARLVQVILKKISVIPTDNSKKIIKWKGGRILSSVLKQILFYDFKISNFFLKKGFIIPGLSCYIIFQK